MKIVYFTHSLRSCWNHGNAHFQRGLMREFGRMGIEAVACEAETNWSLSHLLADHGDAGLHPFRAAFPDLSIDTYSGPEGIDVAIDGADLVLVHEWNDPRVVAQVGRRRKAGARFQLFFHDTHHRAVSDPGAIRRYDLDGYDGVLAFGEALSEVYRRWGWGDRVSTWHEAADVTLFHPPAAERKRRGLVWIGNFGDGERTAELETYLFQPAIALEMPLDVHGVRYPPQALEMLERYGARYHGFLPNARAPDHFAEHIATVHVPRRLYAERLPGIPTIRVFEALACGIPLICSTWRDCERLFRPGTDYLVAEDGAAMRRHLTAVSGDADLRRSLAASGLQTIHERHTCAHRATELLAIARRHAAGRPMEKAS